MVTIIIMIGFLGRWAGFLKENAMHVGLIYIHFQIILIILAPINGGASSSLSSSSSILINFTYEIISFLHGLPRNRV